MKSLFSKARAFGLNLEEGNISIGGVLLKVFQGFPKKRFYRIPPGDYF